MDALGIILWAAFGLAVATAVACWLVIMCRPSTGQHAGDGDELIPTPPIGNTRARPGPAAAQRAAAWHGATLPAVPETPPQLRPRSVAGRMVATAVAPLGEPPTMPNAWTRQQLAGPQRPPAIPLRPMTYAAHVAALRHQQRVQQDLRDLPMRSYLAALGWPA